MSTLPPELLPKTVPTDFKQQAAEILTALGAAIAADQSFFFATAQTDGTVSSWGRATVTGSLNIALSALTSWANSAELLGDTKPRAMLNAFMAQVGASKEYVYGGSVPERR